MTNPYELAAAALAAIDVLAWETRLQALFDERERIERAIESADAKIRAKAAEVESAKVRGPDGSAAADALLDDGDVTAVAAKPGLLEAELAALKAGRGELNHRRVMIGHDITRLREDLAKVLADALDPVIAEFRSLVETSSNNMIAAYAGCEALARTSGHKGARYLVERLRQPLNALANENLCKRAPTRPETELLELLETVRPAIEFAHGRIVNEVAFPAS